MMSGKSHSVWLIGAGPMAVDYMKVLAALSVETKVIGRGAANAGAFEKNTGVRIVRGGLDGFLAGNPPMPDAVIVSVDVGQHLSVVQSLLKYGIRRILLEKPGGASISVVKETARAALAAGVDIPLAYNRRFYASTRTARRCIREDGGVRSFTFELTEWSHVIAKLDKPRETLETLFLNNSTHVADMAFFLAGDPAEIDCRVRGRLPWHPAGSIFVGSGISESGNPFSYFGDWEAPGRWGVEVLTAKRRYIFRPLEKLQIQENGSIAIVQAELDDGQVDIDFKPGLFRQVEAFLDGHWEDFRMLSSQAKLVETYARMAGYTDAP